MDGKSINRTYTTCICICVNLAKISHKTTKKKTRHTYSDVEVRSNLKDRYITSISYHNHRFHSSGKYQIIHWRQGHKEECQPQDVCSFYSFVSILKIEYDSTSSLLEPMELRSQCNLKGENVSSAHFLKCIIIFLKHLNFLHEIASIFYIS